jgi:RNA polymerase sigma-70 factor (ECF subfamily)
MTPAPAADDEELVARARAGDRSALEELLRRHHDRIRLLCLRMCRDRQDADDATQEALMAIVRGLDGFDGRSSFATWAYRVATNRCTDEIRRRRRRPEPVDEHDHDVPADDEDPADGAVRGDVRALLRAALDDLPDEFREVVVLRDVLDLDYATIAEVLEIRPGTVRSRLARARARLAAALEDPALEGGPGARPGNPPPSADVQAVDRSDDGTGPDPLTRPEPGGVHPA